MKIFLTGGSGFIGKNIKEKLGHKYQIIAPTHAELDLTDSDAVFEFLKNNPVDLVIHAANVGGTRKQQHIFGITHTNLRIFFNLVRAKEFFGRMINLGSGAEYGKHRDLKNISENNFDECVPKDEYGLYKYVCSKYAEEVEYITHLRLFAVFGKYEDYEIRFISYAICRALLGLPIDIRQNVRFDYLFIDDFVKILEKFIENKPSEKFINIGRGESVELAEITKMVLKETGINVPVFVENPGMGFEYTCDNKKMLKETGNLTFTSLEMAIASLTAFYKSALPEISKKNLISEI